MRPGRPLWIKHIQAIDKHLDKNEKWFQYPEKRMLEFEKRMDQWNGRFMKNMNVLEDWFDKFEKKMEE
ncbi:hypothetical protein GMD78_19570 [Ornithinibacillus sp. L9]|uniref:Uncharacterized protein n=1 Tax=Ornithinibacillus caprae TaxID=2678566 RepID=A0A6N8FQY3_9BACI|nr:hypothetical protein [Ornithinibacillus caprae]MUK90559.1 hypothetical protein [Ornithinibacillus caprae]